MSNHTDSKPAGLDHTQSASSPSAPRWLAEREAPIDADVARLQRGDLIVVIGTTTRVLDDCRIANGAVITAPSHLPSYPVEAPDGMVCRPGESLPLVIAAAAGLGRNERTPVLAWLTNRAAGFNEDGYLRRSHALHGRVTDRRPDRMGTALLLWAICAYPERATSYQTQRTVRQLAAGLALGRDRRQASPTPLVDLAESALAAMALHSVSAILPADEWERAAVREEERRDGLMANVLVDLEAGSLSDPGLQETPASLRDASSTGPRRLFPDDGTEQSALVALSWVAGVEPALRAAALDKLTKVLLPEDSGPENRILVADLFWLASALEQGGHSERAGDVFATTLDLADVDGHFPEWVRRAGAVETAATPSLTAHLTFLLAAGVLGRLRDLPQSGYTSASRRS